MARLTLSLLGGFQARLGAGPPLALPAKAQALLAYLALHCSQPSLATSSARFSGKAPTTDRRGAISATPCSRSARPRGMHPHHR
jgi:hypothetical protein